MPESTTYAEWNGKQSAVRQDEILGPERGKLLRQGKLKEFYNDKGSFITLEDLRRFGLAGRNRAARWPRSAKHMRPLWPSVTSA